MRSLIVREQLTASSRRPRQALVDAWRPWIEERAATTLERMNEVAGSQAKFAA